MKKNKIKRITENEKKILFGRIKKKTEKKKNKKRRVKKKTKKIKIYVYYKNTPSIITSFGFDGPIIRNICGYF